jgi:hypothetical protein
VWEYGAEIKDFSGDAFWMGESLIEYVHAFSSFAGRNPCSIFLLHLIRLIFSAAIVVGNEEVLKLRNLGLLVLGQGLSYQT